MPELMWCNVKIVAVTNNYRRGEQDSQTSEQQAHGGFAGTFPLVQSQTPKRAEYHDAGHVERPTREGVPAHLRLTHAVEEELEIPSDAGQSAKQIVSYKWNAHRFPQHVGRRVDKHAGRRAGERGFFDGLWTAWIIELRHRHGGYQ